ncbi:MAG: hypothetical protein V2J51_07195 [Erythrobacter sp.]|jgi:hypothetical protein|nr:hypothetical protein [Erythrobacter sp.]
MTNDDNRRKGLDGLTDLNKALGLALETQARKVVTVDVEKYQAWLDDPALSDEQKEQIVQSLWEIILAFVDLGFGVSPLQDACGQLSEIEGSCGAQPQDVVRSDADTLSDTFNTFAGE